MFSIGDNFTASNVQGRFDFLFEFLDLHGDLYIGDLVEVALQSAEFFGDVVAQGVGHIQLVSTDVDLHTAFSLLPCVRGRREACRRNTVAWKTLTKRAWHGR